MTIRESAEDYLEAILIINERKCFTKSIDIANHLKVTKPSVSVAMKNLREAGYITINEKGVVSLLPAGLEIASKTYERHMFFRDALIRLGVSPETAVQDACRLEHVISEESFNAMKKHLEMLKEQGK